MDNLRDEKKLVWKKKWLKTDCGKRCVISANRRWLWKQKMACFVAYSGDPPKCQCCGESNLGFLTMDHVNNDGCEHRKEMGKGNSIFRWLVKNNFPPGFEVMCFNCNCGREWNNGVCPHKQPINPNAPRRTHRKAENVPLFDALD